MAVEMLPPPATARADLEAILAARRRHAEKRLQEMVAYAEGAACRHARCTGTITRLAQGGRATFYCPVCQR